MWIAPESACHPDGRKRLVGAPDLIAEVLSPSTALRDRRDKFHLYEQYGVREYWIVDPRDQLVEVWVRRGRHFVRVNVYSNADVYESPLLGNVAVNEFFV
jgi:Uma2 family endonuclease